jgi:O-antigen/teichoic acid export membrane protein
MTFADLFKGAFWSVGGSALSALGSAATVKILAVYLGPAGVGVYSILKQLTLTATTVATLNSQGALVSATAGEKWGEVAAGIKVIALCALVVAAAMAIAAEPLGVLLLPALGSDAASAIRVCAIAVIAGTAAMILTALANGYRRLRALAVGQAVGAVCVTVAAVLVAVNWRGESVWLAVPLVALSTGIVICHALWQWRAGILSTVRRILGQPRDGAAQRRFLALSGAMLLTGFATTATVLLVRALIVRYRGIEEAGLLDAAWTISAGYIGLALGSFGTYYMPTLAAANVDQRPAIMRRVLLATCAIAMPMIVLCIAFAPQAIALLYSERFLASAELLRWLLVGDFLKATAWVFAYLVIAVPHGRMLLAADLGWNLAFLSAVWFLVDRGTPLAAIGAVYASVYAVYLALFWFYARKRHAFRARGGLALAWWACFALVAVTAACAAAARNDIAMAMVPVAAIAAALLLKSRTRLAGN